MREGDPMRPAGHKGALRADCGPRHWAATRQGGCRATELRGSDYFGPGTTPRSSYLNDIVIDAVLTGRTPIVPVGRSAAPHSWTYVPDVGALAARLASGGRRLGSALARADLAGALLRRGGR